MLMPARLQLHSQWTLSEDESSNEIPRSVESQTGYAWANKNRKPEPMLNASKRGLTG
jgi:hypothetical protein